MLGLLGCAGRGQPPPAVSATGDTGEPWFCEMQGYNGWRCTRGEGAAATPRPERLPEPRDQLRGTDATQPANVGAEPRPQPPAAAASVENSVEDSVEDSVENSVEPEAVAAPEPDARPAYARLAYQPPEPTALLDLPSTFYAVQLLAMPTPDALEAYARQKGLPELSAAPIEKDGERLFVLLLGIYETRGDAEAAVAELPETLADVDPWIRPLGSLQTAIRRAESLPD